MNLQEKIDEYLKFECDEDFIKELQNAGGQEIVDAFSKRIKFGTAGLRARMSFGIKYMSCGSVWRASQGLCAYYLKSLPKDEVAKTCVIIGYDARYKSRYFAAITAAVFLSKGLKVHMHDKETFTPLNPFCVVKYKALCGVQITASHNPKMDNGYKVYGPLGAQILSPVDVEVEQEIESQSVAWEGVNEIIDHENRWINFNHPLAANLIDSYEEDWNDYCDAVTEKMNLGSFADVKLKIGYSAMHGVGYRHVKELLDKLDYPKSSFFSVPEQQNPDPEFPTVKFPNPEEAGATDMSLKHAEQNNCNLVFLNDPDADRLLCIEYQSKTNSYYQFTGDELGVLLCHFAYEIHSKHGKMAMARSAVCCGFMDTFVKHSEGKVAQVECLTGFKWLATNLLREYETYGRYPAYGYEEALGYALCVDIVPDKDGVSAMMGTIKLASRLHELGLTLKDHLEQLMENYKYYFVTKNGYYIIANNNVLGQAIKKFRNNNYELGIPDFKVSRVVDMAIFYDSSKSNKKPDLPNTGEDMLMLTFENGFHVTYRNSGTEPKLKYYSEMVSDISQDEARANISNYLQIVSDALFAGFELN